MYSVGEPSWSWIPRDHILGCENSLFSPLVAAGDALRGGYSSRNVLSGEERGETVMQQLLRKEVTKNGAYM